MATPNFRPNANNEGSLGTDSHRWAQVNATQIKEAGVRVATVTSPALGGTPTSTTPSASDNSTKIATTAYVQTNLVGTYAKLDGSQTVGNLMIYKATGLQEDSDHSPATLLARANHTGVQTKSTITDLVTDLATLTTNVATNATAIALKADEASPELTGTPTAPTAGTSTDTTQIATTAYVKANTADKAGLSSPPLTGTPTAPTAVVGTNTTQLATTAFVAAEIAADIAPLATKASPALTGTPTAPTAGTSTDTTQIATTAYVKANTADKAGLSSPPLTGIPTAPTASASTNTTQIATTAFVNAEIAAAGYAASLHTHTSANISDAASAATASKIVIRDAAGGAAFAATTGSAVLGTATGSGGDGVTGNATGGSGKGVIGTTTSATGVGVEAQATHASSSALVANQSGTGGIIADFNYDSEKIVEIKTNNTMLLHGDGAFASTLNFSTITADRAVVWPDAAGTVVLGDGGGITDAGAFRTALGVGTAESPDFAKVVVDASTSNGYNFDSGAKIVLEDVNSATVYTLPDNTADDTSTLVDGDGRGITSASDFRDAIGVTGAAGGTFTDTVTINPSSGSDMFALTGAAGNTATISCDPGGNITIGMPTTNSKTLALVADTDGLIDATDIADSTSVGRSLITAADASAARLAIGVGPASNDYIYAYGSINNSDATVISVQGTFVIADPGTLTSSVAVNFAVPTADLCRVTYTGSETKVFKIDAQCSADPFESSESELSMRIGKNGTSLNYTEIGKNATGPEQLLQTHCILSLAEDETVEIYIANESGTENIVVTHSQLVITPVGA